MKEGGFKPGEYVHTSTVYIQFMKIFTIKKMKMIEGMEVTSE